MRGLFFKICLYIIVVGGENMDQQKIGKFISELRKKKGLTQKQIAEKLLISEKTVSKWECGNGMPDVSLMIPLCEILEISVNELLSGEKLSQEKYVEKAEVQLVKNLKTKKLDDKKKFVASFMIGIFCTIILMFSILLADLVNEVYIKILLISFAIVLFLMGIVMSIILDIEVGNFECPNCHERYTPTFRAYFFGMHTIKKRTI